MDLKVLTTIAAPLITACIAFALNKYFQNKPKLIAFYGSKLVHKMPVNTGYQIYAIELDNEPDKYQLDTLYSQKNPLIIKYKQHSQNNLMSSSINNKGYHNPQQLEQKENVNYSENVTTENIWIYGIDSNFETKLTRSTNPLAYSNIQFSKDPILLKNVANEICELLPP